MQSILYSYPIPSYETFLIEIVKMGDKYPP